MSILRKSVTIRMPALFGYETSVDLIPGKIGEPYISAIIMQCENWRELLDLNETDSIHATLRL